MTTHRRVGVGIPAFLLLLMLVGTGAYLYGREAGGSSSSARSDEGPVPPESVPGPLEMPTPGATPDTSDPLWGIPYRNEDSAKPRFDQVVAGIAVGPTVKVASSGICQRGEARYADPSLGASSPLAFSLTSLPANARLDRETVIECGGTVVAIEQEYYLVPAPDAEGKVRRGEVSWFDVEHGGAITIFKGYKQFPAQDSNIAAERWSAGSIAGHPAAVGRPILDDGFGDSMVVVWNEGEGVQVVVAGLEVRLRLLLEVANEVIR